MSSRSSPTPLPYNPTPFSGIKATSSLSEVEGVLECSAAPQIPPGSPEDAHRNSSLGMERAGLEERISGKGIETLGIPLEGNSSMQGVSGRKMTFKEVPLQTRNISATRWVTVGQSSLRGRRVVGWFSLPLPPCPLAFPCWKEPCSSPAVAKTSLGKCLQRGQPRSAAVTSLSCGVLPTPAPRMRIKVFVDVTSESGQ